MSHKHVFEAVNRILRDFMKAIDPLLKEIPFKGNVVVFEGDFCQILLVCSLLNKTHTNTYRCSSRTPKFFVEIMVCSYCIDLLVMNNDSVWYQDYRVSFQILSNL